MCTKFKLITGNPLLAIKKEGSYPVLIADSHVEVIVHTESDLEGALDVLRSGLLEGDNPRCEVNHYYGD